jgi:hypothetical protein
VRRGLAVGSLGRTGALALPQHPDEHRSERPVLLAVDQALEVNPSALLTDTTLGIDLEGAVMDNLDDLEDDKWWKRLLTRWDNLSLARRR